ncbi:MAG: hypothetical protein PHT34_00115, partial [Oscillospiraceae bacterium]|nr:hypothetical protein [Oscillospiraceae bacterium]
MLAITRALEKNSEVNALLKAIDAGGCPAVFSGLSGIHRAHLGAAVEHASGRPVIFICPDEGEA